MCCMLSVPSSAASTSRTKTGRHAERGERDERHDDDEGLVASREGHQLIAVGSEIDPGHRSSSYVQVIERRPPRSQGSPACRGDACVTPYGAAGGSTPDHVVGGRSLRRRTARTPKPAPGRACVAAQRSCGTCGTAQARRTDEPAAAVADRDVVDEPVDHREPHCGRQDAELGVVEGVAVLGQGGQGEVVRRAVRRRGLRPAPGRRPRPGTHPARRRRTARRSAPPGRRRRAARPRGTSPRRPRDVPRRGSARRDRRAGPATQPPGGRSGRARVCAARASSTVAIGGQPAAPTASSTVG